MSFIGNFYDPNAEPDTGFELIPGGNYQFEIVESDFKPTQNGKGDVLKLKMYIIDGEFQGRILFDNLTLRHDNETAQRIAQSKFAALRQAVDVPSPQNSDELHHKAFWAEVGIEKRKDTGENQNRIKRYLFGDSLEKALNGAPPAANDNHRAPAAAANDNRPAQSYAAAKGSRPWAGAKRLHAWGRFGAPSSDTREQP